MEFYIKDLEQYLVPDYSIVLSEGCNNTSVTDGVISIDIGCLDDCPDTTELHNMLVKRLSPKKKAKGVVDHKTIAVCCLASRGYNVNHKSIYGVSDKEMCKIWSTLERSKISSSSRLRVWISKCMSFRSYEGFSGTMGRDKVVASVADNATPARVSKISKATVMNTLKVELVIGTSFTMRGAMATDAKLLHASMVCSGKSPPDFGSLLR